MLSEPTSERPCHIDNDYLKWSIPSHIWSGEQYGEDKLEVRYYFESDSWEAHTEMDQNVKRDLSEDDIVAIRKEFGLDAWVEYLQPSKGLNF